MPPKKRRGNKKKGSAKKQPSNNRSNEAGSCGFCARLVDEDGAEKENCVCTQVVFCNATCRNQAIATQKHICPGPPSDRVVDLQQRLQELEASGHELRLQSGPMADSFHEEYRITITEPTQQVLVVDAMKTGRAPKQDFKAADFAAYADQGHAAMAYLAGVHYKNRMLGTNTIAAHGHAVSRATSGEEQQSVLETNDLAFRYFNQASEAGIGLAMQSLGECYEKGIGVRANMLHCRNWLWHSSLLRSVGALDMLNSKIIVERELDAMADGLGQSHPGLLFGRPIHVLGGPHLGSLFLVLGQALAEMQYTLPPFASLTPTATVGNSRQSGATAPVEIVSASVLERLVMGMRLMTQQLQCTYRTVYGRRGIAKSATAQTYGQAIRDLDSPIVAIPPAAACDERVTQEECARWMDQERRVQFSVQCVHAESQEDSRPTCKDCIREACDRLAAVSTHSVALSEEELLQGRGRLAIWKAPNGVLKSETFKHYGRCEAECALASLVACQRELAHPLFVAQDPNFFWPLIQSHGCVRAALEYVAPHVDWNERLGSVKPLPEGDSSPLVEGSEPGDYLRKCGNDLCLNLEADRSSGNHAKCGLCLRRSYCSRECSKADAIFHKRECQAATSGSTPAVQQPVPTQHDQQPTNQEQAPLSIGEEVVVHDLQSQQRFNGLVGVIRGERTSQGRHPLKVPNHDSLLAIKPSNLYRLGVRCIPATAKKAAKFQCSNHGSELCGTCSLDFGPANRLSKLCRSRGSILPLDEMEQVLELYFATIATPDDETRVGEFEEGFPMECHGLVEADKRFVLKSLLSTTPGQDGTKSMQVLAAVAGLLCFGARVEPVCRPFAPKHLETLLKVAYPH